jgi:hypothetical protein
MEEILGPRSVLERTEKGKGYEVEGRVVGGRRRRRGRGRGEVGEAGGATSPPRVFVSLVSPLHSPSRSQELFSRAELPCTSLPK